MDVEKAVISCVVQRGEIVEAVNQELGLDLFRDTAHDVWEWILEYYSKYGTSPGHHAFSQKWPEYELTIPTEPVEFYADALRNLKKFNILKDHYVEAGRLMKGGSDPTEAVEKLRAALVDVENVSRAHEDMDYRETRKDRHDRYERTKEAGGIEGIPFPFPTLSKLTGGQKEEDLIFIVAYTGVGKTWKLILNAIHASLHTKRTVNFHSNEMPDWQIGRRTDAIVYDLPYGHLVQGELGFMHEARWLELLDKTIDPDVVPDIKVFGAEGAGWSYVDAKADLYNPAAVYIDGGYIMEDSIKGDAQWQRIGRIARQGKSFAKRRKIPTTISFQLTEDGKLALYRGLEQWADTIIELRQTPDQKLADTMEIVIRKLREGEGNETILLRWDFNNMQFQEINIADGEASEPENEHANY